MNEPSDYCEALVRESDKDRFLATLFAPAASRRDLFALYAFDLETASVSHRVRDPAAGEVRLQWWHDALSEAGEGVGHPVVEAFARVLRRHGIDRGIALQVIDARRQALYPDRGRDEAEFELSASDTIGAIVRMAAHILAGPPAEPVRLAAHHIAVAAAAANAAPDSTSFDAAALSARHRNAARTLIATLPDAVLPTFLPLTLAFAGRSSCPQWRKQWMLWRASKNLARWI